MFIWILRRGSPECVRMAEKFGAMRGGGGGMRNSRQDEQDTTRKGKKN